MEKYPAFEMTVSLPARLTGIEQDQAARAVDSPADLEKLLLMDRVREARKEKDAIERILKGLSEAAGSLKTQQRDYLRELQRLAIELAVAIASRLLHDQIEAGELPVENLMRAVIERLDTRQTVTVFLHPDDLALLQSRLGEEKSLLAELADVQLSRDPTLARGAIRAQAGDISVLTDLEEQLAELGRELRDTLAAAAAEPESAGPELRPFEGKRQSA